MTKTAWADRIVASGEKPPSEFLVNPDNFRTHPDAQEAALAEALDKVGWVRRVLVNRTTGRMLDGHLRVRLAARRNEPTVPYDEVELTEAEEKLVLATLDPLSAMAGVDFNMLGQLVTEIDLSDTALLESMLADMRVPALGQRSGEKAFTLTTINVADLKFHPRNYREHPEDQLAHLVESIQSFGLYRNVVVANDGTVLAGQGIMQAVRKLGLSRVPVVQLQFGPEDPRAVKLMIGDNEMSKLGMADDRKLTEMLKEIMDVDAEGLLGTGYSPEQLAALVMTTRPKSEIGSKDAAAEWVGMPDYENVDQAAELIIRFRNKDDRETFVQQTDMRIRKKGANEKWVTWWPWKEDNDLASVKFEG